MGHRKNNKVQTIQKEVEVVNTSKELIAVFTNGTDQSSKVTVSIKDVDKFDDIKSAISENIGRDYVIVFDDNGAVNLRFYSRVSFYLEDVKEGE